MIEQLAAAHNRIDGLCALWLDANADPTEDREWRRLLAADFVVAAGDYLDALALPHTDV